MDLRVHARNVSLEDEFRSQVEERVDHATRYFDHITNVDVELTEESNPRLAPEKYRLEITAHAAGQLIRIESAAPTADSALDDAAHRFEQQLRRLKERLVERSRRQSAMPPPAQADVSDDVEIVRVKQFVMKPMSPEEAILQMDMLGHNFFLFENAESGQSSVVYQRRDGRYGLIEPA